MREQFEDGLSIISGAKALVQNISTQYEDSLLDLALNMPMAIIKVVNHGEALTQWSFNPH